MNLYIMRHGKTEWNEIGIIQGRSSNPLSKFGTKQVKQRADEFKAVKFDAIFCSPLERTKQTALIMNTFSLCPITYLEELTEIDQGIFTGQKKDNLTEQQIQQKNNRLHSSMEQFRDVYIRAGKFLDNLKLGSFNSVLVVTHDIVAIMLENIILKNKLNLNCSNFVNDFNNAEIKHFNI